MPTSETPMFDRLAELQERAREVARMPGQIAAQRNELLAELERARFELRRFYAAAGEHKPAAGEERRLKDAVGAAQAAVEAERWSERIAGAAAAGRNAAAAVERFIAEHIDELAGESVVQTVGERDAFAAAAAAMVAAWNDYEQSSARRWTLLIDRMEGGRQANALASSHRVAQPITELRRALLAGVPLIVPRSLREIADPTLTTAA